MLALYILLPLAALAVFAWCSHRTGKNAYRTKMRRVDFDEYWLSREDDYGLFDDEDE